MKYKELTNKSEAEVGKMLEELRGQAHDLSMKLKLNEVKTSHTLGQLKKDIARILTYIRSLKK